MKSSRALLPAFLILQLIQVSLPLLLVPAHAYSVQDLRFKVSLAWQFIQAEPASRLR